MKGKINTRAVYGVTTNTNTAKIHILYNPEHDTDPSETAPRVTWREKLLADEIDRLQRMIDRLIERVDELTEIELKRK